MRRQFAAESESLKRRLLAWHFERCEFASAVLDEPLDEVIARYTANGGYLYDLPCFWPLRLSEERRPERRTDRRYLAQRRRRTATDKAE